MGKKIVLVSLNQFNLPQNKLQLRDKNENASGFGSRVLRQQGRRLINVTISV